jgi:hypothetical protein
VLSWVLPVDNNFISQSVKVLRDGVQVADVLAWRSPSTYTDTGLVNGTNYNYKVIRVINQNAQLTLPGQEVVETDISAKPFGKPIVETITATELTTGGYTTYDASINVNGSALIGCFVLGIPLDNTHPILVITSPVLTNASGPTARLTGTFSEVVSSFAIAPYNAGGSAFVGYPEQNSGFGAP